jgi:hypothetical protein
MEYVSLWGPEIAFTRGVRAEAIVGAVPPDETGAFSLTPERFRENPAFVAVLKHVIGSVMHLLDDVRDAARRQGDGHVYLIDERTPDPAGEVPPADIIGAVEVRDGAPVAGSYRHNPNHRLYTADGFFRLPAALERELRAMITP